MAGWHHLCNGHELGQTLGDDKGQRGLACCSPWGHKALDVTGRMNNNKGFKSMFVCLFFQNLTFLFCVGV